MVGRDVRTRRHGQHGERLADIGGAPQYSLPFTLARAEGRRFPSHRCLVPASEFLMSRHGQRYRFSLADGDWFYFAGIWQPASEGWPEAYAILTIEANADVARYHDRQMAVLRRRQRMD
jgi:putative SOS response-associated peptidase YedK